MMMKAESLAIASVFYHHTGWSSLITGAIVPFIKQQPPDTLINYAVYLSTLQGDHVVISFMLSANPAEFEKQFFIFIEDFIARNPSITLPPVYPLDSLFMDFPNNRLFFGIEKKFISPPGAIQSSVTSAITASLALSDMDAAARFTFILYLQLAFIKAKYNDMNNACTAIAQIRQYLLANDENMTITGTLPHQYAEIQQQLYDNNDNILQEVITDIWNHENSGAELLWLEEWITFCRAFTGDDHTIQPFLTISNSIFEQMGLNGSQLQPVLLNIYYKSFKTNLNTFYYE